LAKVVNGHAQKARQFDNWRMQPQALEEVKAAAGSLRAQVEFSQRVAGWLQNESQSA
jgi:hypothetical protein